MFIAYLHLKFHITNSNESLVIAIQREVEEKFRLEAMLYFHILQKYFLNQTCLSFGNII
jgi:hypothetical protein